MHKQIVLGKYILRNSLIHRLDPRTKMISIFLMILLLFINPHLWAYGIYAVILLVMFYVAKIPFLEVIKSLRAVGLLLFFTFIFRLMITPGEPFFEFSFITFTYEGLQVAIRLALRITLMILFASLLSFTTTPKDMADGIEKMLWINSQNSRYHAQISNISIMVMIAFRFIPILMDEVQNIQKAQLSRGANYERVGLIDRSKNIASVTLPFFLSVLERAIDLGHAIDARGYDETKRRTRLYPLHFDKWDWLVLIGTVFFLWLMCLVYFPLSK